jgi:hypothetical protein
LLAACSGVLGLTDPKPFPDEAGAPLSDGGRSSSGDPTARSEGGGSCIANLQTDAHNCGACGHDCGRGTCEGGACQPFVLATLDWGPFRITSDDAYLYVTGSVQIARIDKTSGEVTALPSTENAFALTVADGILYWSTQFTGDGSSSFIKSCRLPQCSPPNTLAQVGNSQFGTARSLVVANGFGGTAPIVWVDLGRG